MGRRAHLGTTGDGAARDRKRTANGEAVDSAPSGQTDFAFRDLFNGRDLTGWIDVNTRPETWSVKDGLLVCKGKPIGVMRSEKQYENFVMEIEWRHMEPAATLASSCGCDAIPADYRLPKGMEVQMLELDWINIHKKKDGTPQPVAYVQGELFGAGGMTATPANPRGNRR